MPDVFTLSRRHVGNRVAVATAAVTTLAAIALVGPAVEELREEATRTQRRNALSRVALAVSADRSADWSPVWAGPGGAVPDYLADVPDALTYLAPREGWSMARDTVSLLPAKPGDEVVTMSQSGPPGGRGYFPNWDLFEPVGVRQIPLARRSRPAPEQAAAKPTTPVPPQPGVRLPVPATATISIE